ncbi:50S ribosomal protein L7/L12 [Schaalia suimastitidis]|uniref:50S ribosomal protein L7/L12 n=1 Tax=Schaalia suimastitidis TaxID=121163 RepID=UPI000428CE7B|nr:50S ribosomal protein L7/L12 [Schaalia suimastitidis]
MAKLSNDELIEAFKEMSLIELSDFVKLFEETFDVTAAAPAAVAVAAAPAAGEEAAAEEKSEFEVVLESAGDKKIAVVKAVKALTGLGLKEAKELVDNAPSTIFENAKKEDAEKAKAEIEEAGGTVTLK